MDIGVIVFARMSSTRVPGKALLPVGHRPLLGHVIDRARRIRLAKDVVLATSMEPSDEPLVDFARREGVNVFRGALVDVAQRALDCAAVSEWTAFARVCGDRPFLDPVAIDRAIERMVEDPAGPPDMVSNLLVGRVAPGLTVEVVHVDALARVLRESVDPQDREHLTRYLYRHPERFRLISGGEPPPATDGLRFAVDTVEDLERTRFVVEQLSSPAAASVLDVAQLMEGWRSGRQERAARS